VGAGNWGKNHIQTLDELGALGGIVESDLKNLARVSKKYPDVRTYSNVDDALKDNKCAGFVVATPAITHYKIAEKIIIAEKHVLVEKPLVLNIEDAEHLLLLSKKNKVNLMVGHVLLFHPAIRKIKELIEEGKIGELQYIYSNRLNLGEVRKEENVFWSLAPHDIAIFQYFTESFPIDIYANGCAFLQNKIHDYTITQLKYPTGVEGHIFVSWLHPFKEQRLVVIGSEAMITFEDSVKGKPLKLYSKRYNLNNDLLEKIDGPIKMIKYENKMALTEEIKHFIESIGSKKEMIADGDHAFEVMKIITQASDCLEKI